MSWADQIAAGVLRLPDSKPSSSPTPSLEPAPRDMTPSTTILSTSIIPVSTTSTSISALSSIQSSAPRDPRLLLRLDERARLRREADEMFEQFKRKRRETGQQSQATVQSAFQSDIADPDVAYMSNWTQRAKHVLQQTMR